jgi:mannan polymerase II complex MNN10 subunit
MTALMLPSNPNPNEVHLLISHNRNGLNPGSFFLRRNNWTEMLLELWRDPILMLEKKWWALEQDALVHIFLHHHQFLKGHVGIVAQKEFNAYAPDDVNRESLNKGDIILEAQFLMLSSYISQDAGE